MIAEITAYRLSDGTIVEDKAQAVEQESNIQMLLKFKELIEDSNMSIIDKQNIEAFFNANLEQISLIVLNNISLISTTDV